MHIAHMLDTLWNGSTQMISQPSEIDGVGHRVVHGGKDYRESVVIISDFQVLADGDRRALRVHLQGDTEVSLTTLKTAIQQILTATVTDRFK